MKRILTIIFFCIVLIPISAHARTQYIEQENARFQQGLLQNAVNYLDHLCLDQLDALANIADSEVARSGEWVRIKPALEALYTKIPGVYFYVLPDGSYYSIALDKTSLNLANRPYFNPLFAGEKIRGYPVYSRSSGKKSVILAAPIRNEAGQVTGALGASLFLEELRTQVESEIPFPPDYTWFVINNEGDTLLDRDVDYLFMNTITQGSPSMKKAITRALAAKAGDIAYDLGGARREGYFARLPELGWTMILAQKIDQPTVAEPLPGAAKLETLVESLQKSIEAIDTHLRLRLREVSGKPHAESDLRKEFLKLLNELPQVIEVVYVDSDGVLAVIEPAEYQLAEGADISSQPHVQEMNRRHTPLLTDTFATVEGYQGALISHPFYNERGQFIGAVSALFRPEFIVEKEVGTLSSPTENELIVMETSGTIVFDQDLTQRGLNLFTDPRYEGYFTLRELGRKIVSQPKGAGMYVFPLIGTTTKAVKRAQWDSVGLHGRQWRVIMVRPEQK